ncbi:glycosyltransferase family 39 protein [Adhaeribacter soli]|uniref:Glycosyltransferase family 39 protein n=1 Tax=Adhaeribacter soli TaxID=2607655 RepID=A0A5N1ISD0_9BACT|nr:glycosyltransferase family 39 protein [Adhaeribacter soli]KAA9331863.1 glycosyltransferase family 39 protein [Adhaeribacter soli]
MNVFTTEKVADPESLQETKALRKKRNIMLLAFWAVFIGLGILFYHKSVFFLPRGIHEWAQADRLALAMQFYDRGFNFFKPATYSLTSIDGIVGVEFPLQAYLAALLGLVFGRGNISVMFRVLDILVAFTGFYFLFRLVLEKTNNFWLAILPGIFMLGSPVFAYYAGNYLPDPFSTAIVFIGFYFFFRFTEKRQTKDLGISFALFTLAGLVKTTSCIFLLSAAGFLLFISYLQPAYLTLKQKLTLLACTLMGLGVVAGYTFYNRYLNSKYQAWIFLADIKPIKDGEMLSYIRHRYFDVWRFEYFTRFQYLLIYASILLFLVFIISHFRKRLPYAAMVLISFVGGTFFFVLMGSQLIDHDYYIISAYYPIVMLLLLLAIFQFAASVRNKYLLSVVPVGLCIGLLFSGLKYHNYRLDERYKSFSDYYSYPWMMNGADIIKAAGVEKDARLLVLSGKSPNLALVYFDRQGFVWGITDENMPESLAIKQKMGEMDLQYALINKPDFEKLLNARPDLMELFEAVVQNKQFVVLRPL